MLRGQREDLLHFGRDLDARIHLDRDGLRLLWPFAVRRTVYVPGATQGELTPG